MTIYKYELTSSGSSSGNAFRNTDFRNTKQNSGAEKVTTSTIIN